jgi:hypothetical protein
MTARPAASMPAPLITCRRDGAVFPVDFFFMILPLMTRQKFLISAPLDIRVSFCEHWSNGVGCGRSAFGGGADKAHRFNAIWTMSYRIE